MKRHTAGMPRVLLPALLLLLSGCRAPKYVTFVSPDRDFACEIPWGWGIYIDGQAKDYTNATFAGPFELEFLRGTPSLSVRWYAYRAPHRLPGGGVESYSSVGDFTRQMLRQVYGPGSYTKAGADQDQSAAAGRGEALPDASRIRVSGVEGVHYVVYRTMTAPPKATLGVVQDEEGRAVVRQRHAYVLVPLARGFYVLVYPATREGYEKYKPAFFHLVNTFRVLKPGP